jgi:hypothetical protein
MAILNSQVGALEQIIHLSLKQGGMKRSVLA